MSFLNELLNTLTDKGRSLLALTSERKEESLNALCHSLFSARGEASGVAMARDVLARYESANAQEKLAFFLMLAREMGPNEVRLEKAIAAFQSNRSVETLAELNQASEPKRQELLRRLNLAPNGTATLVKMRETLLGLLAATPELNALDMDFQHLFTSWFNRGFLVLKPIDWSTSASTLEKIIAYEAVHEIKSWEDLRRRLAPQDRKCFAFFHPQLADDPLIFVEVALTKDIPNSIQEVLREKREMLDIRKAKTAVFYSISNCQVGLKGVTFGNFLIKQVVEELKREVPSLQTFVTLSPAPNFRKWVEKQDLPHEERELLSMLNTPTEPLKEKLAPTLQKLAARYYLQAKSQTNRPLDSVARFHLGNGARLERLNLYGDLSPKGLKESYGLMANYLYDLEKIEENHEIYAEKKVIAVNNAIAKMV